MKLLDPSKISDETINACVSACVSEGYFKLDSKGWPSVTPQGQIMLALILGYMYEKDVLGHEVRTDEERKNGIRYAKTLLSSVENPANIIVNYLIERDAKELEEFYTKTVN